MIAPAVTTPAPARPEIIIRGDRLPLSPAAISAAARLLLAVVRQRKAQQQVDQAGDATEGEP
jgi:hypothetical protein